MPKKKNTRPKRLTKRAVLRALANEGLPKLNIVFYDETDSTNTRARLYAECCEDKKRCDTLFIARRQRGGRGRMGRQFLSSRESGLWMSLLRFDRPADGAVRDTTRAAVAVCRAVEECAKAAGAECSPSVKWVNDIFLGGRKLCGILAEGGYASGADLSYSVVGIGVNLYKTPLPDELSGIITDLYTECGACVDRAMLAAKITRGLLADEEYAEVMEEYRHRLFILGKKITVSRGAESFFATAEELEPDGALIVVDEDGKKIRLNSGEISIRQIPIREN